MKTNTLASLLSSALLTNAQLAYDSSTQSLKCALPNGIYCVGESMSQSYIAHCNNGTATISCCTSELSSLPPLGPKPTALCFQSSITSGDASCVLNGTVYPPKGPASLPSPMTPTKPIPAVVNITDAPPRDCGCQNGTYPLAPKGPHIPISPPLSPQSGISLPSIIPPNAPSAPILPSASSHPTAPPPAASTPAVLPIHPTAPVSAGHGIPTILPTGTGIPSEPMTTGPTSFSYTIGKPTVSPSSSGGSPVRGSDAAAERRGVSVVMIGVVGAVAMLL